MDNDTQHTPAPWHIGMKPGPMIYGERGEQVADMRPHFLVDNEHLANVRLIAAAPDLLAALEDIAGYPHADHAGMPIGRARTIARTAIAKATGEDN